MSKKLAQESSVDSTVGITRTILVCHDQFSPKVTVMANPAPTMQLVTFVKPFHLALLDNVCASAVNFLFALVRLLLFLSTNLWSMYYDNAHLVSD